MRVYFGMRVSKISEKKPAYPHEKKPAYPHGLHTRTAQTQNGRYRICKIPEFVYESEGVGKYKCVCAERAGMRVYFEAPEMSKPEKPARLGVRKFHITGELLK